MYLNNIARNLPFCSFASVLIVSVSPFISKPDYSRDWTIFLISSITLFQIISAVNPNPKIVFWRAVSIADATVVNPNNTKRFLANDVSTFFIIGKPTEINDLRKLRNSRLWLLIFLVVAFSKTPPFSKELITFIISFISLFVRNIPSPCRFFFFFFAFLTHSLLEPFLEQQENQRNSFSLTALSLIVGCLIILY